MVLKMEQGGILQHQIPLQHGYSVNIDHDGSDGCGAAHHQEPFSNTALDPIRQENALSHHLPPSYSYATSQATAGARFGPDRGIGDAGSYQTTGNFTETSSGGSISTSPSSAASSLAYTNYPTTQYTSVQQYPSSVQLSHSFVQPTFPAIRSASILDTSTHSMLPHPSRPHTSSLANVSDRDTFNATATPYLARTQLPSVGYGGINYTTETPRSVVSATAALTLSPSSPYANMAASNNQNYGSQNADCANFPWSENVVLEEMTIEGRSITPKIIPRVEKGFFPDSERWTCYRRNYFSVQCQFQLIPNVAGARITIQHDGVTKRVQAMGMRLAAAVDGPEGKNIELVQHTPKRDAGPKTKIEVVKVAPVVTAVPMEAPMVYPVPASSFTNPSLMTGPLLPLQQTAEDVQLGASQSSQSSQYPYQGSASVAGAVAAQAASHTFERVQFKQATANNGKRRATQQFFHLIVELWADVRKDNATRPDWVKVAQRVSARIVVRGRSPSHYSNEKGEGSHMAGNRLLSTHGYTSMAGPAYTSLNTGAFRGLSSGYAGVSTNHGFRVKAELGYSDGGSQSDSSNSSGEEGPTNANFPADTVMSEDERLALHEHEGYQYFPSTMYESVQSNSMLPPLVKAEDSRLGGRTYAVKAEYADAVPGAQYQASSCGRFQGVDTSRGYFPDLHTRF